jgi:formyl-CoA transferase/CoA:oxalate CoA-transferase
MILAAFGADVIKIERPDHGDDIRSWGPPFWGPESASYLGMNAGKRSVCLDLKDEDDRRRLYRMLEGADVFLESWRPGVARRLGVDFESLIELNPAIVYGSVSAFGDVGPLAGQPGYDPLAQAMTGVMSLTGEPDRPPVRCGVSLIDQTTGMWLALGILVALRLREASGTAQRVDTSLFETGIGWIAYRALGYLATGNVPMRTGSSIDFVAPYQAFDAVDGQLMIAVANDRMFADFCRVLGVPEWANEPKYKTNAARVAVQHELGARIAPVIAMRTVGEWLDALREAGVPAAPVLSVDQALAHEQTRALDMVQSVPHDQIPDLRLLQLPLRLNSERPAYASAPPALGQHTAEVLAEIGQRGAARTASKPAS